MVTFKLVEENERYITYWYYPNGDEEAEHGVIVLDKKTGNIELVKVAPDDISREVSVEEQNSLRNSINDMKKEAGESELTEEEWPSAKEPVISIFYADHAIEKIDEEYKNGKAPKSGMSAWY